MNNLFIKKKKKKNKLKIVFFFIIKKSNLKKNFIKTKGWLEIELKKKINCKQIFLLFN